ncbi:hypothetical protein [Ureibacillus manganicus]|uniref:Uncharacterized protein n=1 Tax=Ureibacillus manganicus DSM 26584 TaxID=1384049 RepID=A0A0A3IAV2_9BACL|nr:hypothetical protein [Ureibacillus manganicus]KGR80600.1 hypothetical protein CD29_01570 [Ureibacillus manganicus DSM 26584]
MDFENIWVQIVFWSILAVIVLSAFLIPRQIMKKKKQHDERFVYNDHIGRSYGWIGSLVVIFICWFLSLAVFHDLLAFWLISAIYCSHMMFYAIGSAIANNRN